MKVIESERRNKKMKEEIRKRNEEDYKESEEVYTCGLCLKKLNNLDEKHKCLFKQESISIEDLKKPHPDLKKAYENIIKYNKLIEGKKFEGPTQEDKFYSKLAKGIIHEYDKKAK